MEHETLPPTADESTHQKKSNKVSISNTREVKWSYRFIVKFFDQNCGIVKCHTELYDIFVDNEAYLHERIHNEPESSNLATNTTMYSERAHRIT